MRLSRSKSVSWFSRWTLTPTLMLEEPIAVRHSLLRILAVADRHSLDVGSMTSLFAQEHWGLNRSRFNALLREITGSDQTLADLKYSRLVSDHSLLAIRLGKSTDTLSSVWNELILWERPADTESCKLWRSNKAYWTVVAIAMMFAATFIVLSVGRFLPRLAEEFEFEPSLLVLQLDKFVLAAVIGLFLFVTCWIVWRLATWLFRPWLRPWASWSPREQANLRINLWRLIAMNLEAGVSVSDSLGHLAQLHYDSHLRRKINMANQSIAEGADPWQSLERANLLRADELQAITATNSVDVQVWTIRRLALRRRENMHFEALRKNMWIQPIITLLFGSFVLAIAYAVFSTLTNLVLSIAERHG